MKFALNLLPIVAALGFVGAGPVAHGLGQGGPMAVTKLVCNVDSYDCTAFLDLGEIWAIVTAGWNTDVFHLSGPTEERMTSMGPIPVTEVNCDGASSTCTATLQYGDGRWFAQWRAQVFPQALSSHEVVGAMAPLPVKGLACSGLTIKCTANLDFNGMWVAEWDYHVGLITPPIAGGPQRSSL